MAILIGFENKGYSFYIDVIKDVMDVFPVDISKQLQLFLESSNSFSKKCLTKDLNNALF